MRQFDRPTSLQFYLLPFLTIKNEREYLYLSSSKRGNCACVYDSQDGFMKKNNVFQNAFTYWRSLALALGLQKQGLIGGAHGPIYEVRLLFGQIRHRSSEILQKQLVHNIYVECMHFDWLRTFGSSSDWLTIRVEFVGIKCELNVKLNVNDMVQGNFVKKIYKN